MKPGSRENLEKFGEVLYPREAAEPILAAPTRAALIEWLEELWAVEELSAAGLKPRHRAIFSGAPGGGKTTLAHHLAARLGLPLLVVESDTIIDKYVGASEQNAAALFRAAAAFECVLFFDEFDTLAHKRVAASQGADRAANNLINTMLQRIERHKGIIIAATNRHEDIDPAIWRRFELHVDLVMPDQPARERIVGRYLAPFVLSPDNLTAFARDLRGASPALIRQLCEGLKRNLVLGARLGWPMGRAEVFSRVLAAIDVHADLQRPPLWDLGAKADGVLAMNWPLKSAAAPNGKLPENVANG